MTTEQQLQNHPPGVVAIPVLDWMWSESAQAIMRLLFNLPPGSDWGFAHGPSTIAPKRNECVRWVLEAPVSKARAVELTMFRPAE